MTTTQILHHKALEQRSGPGLSVPNTPDIGNMFEVYNSLRNTWG